MQVAISSASRVCYCASQFVREDYAMKATTRTAVCGVLVALAVTIPHTGGVRAGQSPAGERALLERDFAGRFNSIIIENTDGATEVQSWGGGRLRVVVTRRAGAGGEPTNVPPVSF